MKCSVYALYSVAAQIGLNPFTSFPVAHAMVDDMVNECVICDYVYMPLSPFSLSSPSSDPQSSGVSFSFHYFLHRKLTCDFFI